MRTILTSGAAAAAALLLTGCILVDADEEADAPLAVPVASPEVTHFKGVAKEGMSLPFSKAVKAGDTIYLAGELGIDPATNELTPGGAGPETTQIFANIERTLGEFDADLSDIVKCTVFLRDMADYGPMNAAYSAALPDPKPARAAFAAKDLALGAALEIDCIAYKP